MKRLLPLFLAVAATAAATGSESASSGGDPYIEVTAHTSGSGISTGYRMKGGVSRVEVDYQLTSTESSGQWRIFGDTSGEKTLGTMFYYTGSTDAVGGAHTFRVRGYIGTVNEIVGDSQWTAAPFNSANTARQTLVTDLKNGKNKIIVSGGETYEKTFDSAKLAGMTADLPLSLFANYANVSATVFANSAKARIYGVRIYENDVIVHDFTPCLKDGTLPCFKDLVGGGFIIGENTAAFAAGGGVLSYQDDAYVSTASNADEGRLYINTLYPVTDDTRVELDCALTENSIPTDGNWFLFDCANEARFNFGYIYGADPHWALQFTAGGNEAAVFGASAFPKPSSTGVKDVRRTFILDNPATSASVVTAGFTNRTVTFTRKTASGNSGKLVLSSYYGGADKYRTPLKIYGCRIYESGVLVRDFKPYVEYDQVADTLTPGLRDSVTGAFVSATDSSGSGDKLAYGGKIDGDAQDAYIESDGTSGINTGYRMKGGVSRVEVDFNLTDAAAQKYVYGGDSGENVIQTFLYTTGTGVGNSFKFCNRPPTSGNDTQWIMTPDTVRRTAVTDLGNKKNSLSGLSPLSKSFTEDFAGKTAALPLTVFGKFTGSAMTGFSNCPKARIYSVRFYENYVEGGDNVPVRELVPYSRDGVIGFYDTVTGEIVKNDSAADGAFTFGGAGTDGALKAYIESGYETFLGFGETTELTAYAPGAVSYRWLRDGVPVSGGTDGTLTVSWSRDGAPETDGTLSHGYQAVAVFEIYGVTKESGASAVAKITSRRRGMTVIIR